MTAVTVPVWLTPYSGRKAYHLQSLTQAELLNVVALGRHAPDDWTRVGSAEVVIHIDPVEVTVAAQVAALRQEQQNIRAAAERKATEIERQIQTLLCIESDAEVQA